MEYLKDEIRTIKLDSPNLQEVYFSNDNQLIMHCGVINDCYVCLRPGYEGESPYIKKSILKEKNQTIVSNLGHSGGGWTLNWSTTLKAIELIDLKNTKEIAIIGGGLMGLTTAICLIENSIEPSKITIYNESNDIKNSAGVGSGAIFSCQVKDPSVRKDFNELILENFNILNRIKKDFKLLDKNYTPIFPFKNLTDKFYLLDFYTGHEENEGLIKSDTGLEPIVDAGLVPPIEIVKIKFNSEKTHLVKKVKTYFFQVFELMSEMQKELVKLGVNFIYKKITEISSLDVKTIFNCSGAKSSDLNSKEIQFKSYSLAGHMISLTDNWYDSGSRNKYEYVLLSPYKRTKDSESDFVVYMPKKSPGSYGVLGSTKIKDYKGGDRKLDAIYYKKIIDNLKFIFGQDTNSNSKKYQSPKF